MLLVCLLLDTVWAVVCYSADCALHSSLHRCVSRRPRMATVTPATAGSTVHTDHSAVAPASHVAHAAASVGKGNARQAWFVASPTGAAAVAATNANANSAPAATHQQPAAQAHPEATYAAANSPSLGTSDLTLPAGSTNDASSPATSAPATATDDASLHSEEVPVSQAPHASALQLPPQPSANTAISIVVTPADAPTPDPKFLLQG